MSYQCDIATTGGATLAVCETFTPQAEVPARIAESYQKLHTWIQTVEVQQSGQNHVIYDDFGPDGMRMRVGFPVSGEFQDSAGIKCYILQPTAAVHTRHAGAYSGLPRAHEALNEWCDVQQLDRRGLAWEVYGDWQEDEAKLVTDVYIAIDQTGTDG